MSIEIKRWDTGEVIYTAEHAQDVRQAVEEAVRSGASLNHANLNHANLDSASLDGANLNGASLNGASLDGANLDGASLYRASLDSASLDGANLDSASLYGASLYHANLNGANLNGANLDSASLYGASLDSASLDGASLYHANLNGASLDGANLLDPSKPGGGAATWTHPLWATRQDIWSILDQAPGEGGFLRTAMIEGRIDGSVYCEDGCGCLTGTLGIACGLDDDGESDGITAKLEMERGIVSDPSRPAEQWFICIRRGEKPLPIDTEEWPSESVFRLSWALAWVDEWRESRTVIGKVLVAGEEKG